SARPSLRAAASKRASADSYTLYSSCKANTPQASERFLPPQDQANLRLRATVAPPKNRRRDLSRPVYESRLRGARKGMEMARHWERTVLAQARGAWRSTNSSIRRRARRAES